MLALLLAVQAGYVDPASCRPCHTQIFDAYMKTGMGRSFSPATQVPQLDNFTHAGSQRSYSIIMRDGAYFLRRAQPELERRIDYVIGSGNHSKTFVHRNAAGRLIELPVSQYGSKWAMSPGYDRPDHSDFRREVTDSCLFCHNGYPSAANSGLASGIDCQRCHGPGEAHVKRGGAIANPGKMASARSLEVCLQCHLESASRTLPEAIRRPGRDPFSFRPGEALADYKVYFEFAKPPAEDRITVNGAGYGLLKSPCFLRGGEGRLQCSTCHDPHGAAQINYTQVCRNCHPAAHEAARRDCTGCHMPKRRTEDAVHVVMTDHFIRKRLPSGDPLAPIEERHDKLTGPVRLLYPAAISNLPADRLVLAMAGDDAGALQAAIAQSGGAQPEPFLRLAELFEKAGRSADGERAYKNAIAADPANPGPYAKIADASALTRFPNDVPLLNTIAVVYAGQSRFDEALVLLRRAVRLAPDDPVSWLNLGVCLEAKGDVGNAIAAYTQTLVMQPDLTRARTYLRRLRKDR